MVQASDPSDRPASAVDGESARPAAPPREGRSASLVSKAVRGAFWMILSGAGGRVFGIVGNLAITHYLNPEEFGEVSLAALIIQLANLFTNGGISQYIASRPKAGRDVIFHATFYYALFGVIGLGATLLFGDRLGASMHAPGIVKYLPAIAFASILDRVSTIQDRVQLRALRFRSVGVQRALGELAYAGVSVGLAAFAAGTPYGGPFAIVWATVARSVLRVATLSLTTPRAEWLSPCKLRWDVTRELFAFGLPMAVVTLAGLGSQKVDNLVFQIHFGLAWITFYNLAYNFADFPAALVSEQLGDVLVPSFAHMDGDEQRRRGLLLALRMMILLVTPLAVGLAVVAPTLSKLAFDPRYQEGIIKVLQILAMFAMARTITWVCNSYLQVRDRARTIMLLETARLVGIVVFMNLFILAGWHLQGRGHAVRWACASVVFVFTLSGVSYMEVIRRLDGVSLRDQLLPLLPPMVACVPMALAVVGVRRLLTRAGLLVLGHASAGVGTQIRIFAPRLLIEILVGAIVFVPSALLLAPTSSREFLRVVRDAVQRRRAPAAAAQP